MISHAEMNTTFPVQRHDFRISVVECLNSVDQRHGPPTRLQCHGVGLFISLQWSGKQLARQQSEWDLDAQRTNQNMSKSSPGSSKKSRGEFFAIDRQIWAEVCQLGLYEAVAYLVLAQGTGRSNRLTKWSGKSLRTYTGIPFERGKPLIEKLKQKGFIRNGEKHSTSKPVYELLSWAEFVAEEKTRRDQKVAGLIEGLGLTGRCLSTTSGTKV
jgi:hypothetical protein